VDRLPPRFWVFHTTWASALAAAWLRERVESRRDTDWMWIPSAHLRYIAPGALSRRVSTKFDGKRLVSSDDAARDLKVQLSGSHAEPYSTRSPTCPTTGPRSASATSRSTSTTRTWDRWASRQALGRIRRPRRAVHPPCPVRPDGYQPPVIALILTSAVGLKKTARRPVQAADMRLRGPLSRCAESEPLTCQAAAIVAAEPRGPC
jgi:hypothetical protein